MFIIRHITPKKSFLYRFCLKYSTERKRTCRKNLRPQNNNKKLRSSSNINVTFTLCSNMVIPLDYTMSTIYFLLHCQRLVEHKKSEDDELIYENERKKVDKMCFFLWFKFKAFKLLFWKVCLPNTFTWSLTLDLTVVNYVIHVRVENCSR